MEVVVLLLCNSPINDLIFYSTSGNPRRNREATWPSSNLGRANQDL